ncbi:uncharacterized protein SPAPADRAFT_48202 [Spathaspora passalidarum NRRL Y-27907]|uniref:Uncharacterized protein n=1 Tax=Spathaspora passalidarum (strain NRRL Y-27907 / 11-Y1) TaxID=619300 RepID=G3AG28_SPAPN|nr:uncharacterized protein SPAPADRAFT_48202 [Spathaspora passalidarum NRRL Y-27907]EGW35167.1 hypothetical protein SPAPADRAFT_48202 [Spathaspora passalidarum NRRL Y-27907]
MLYLEHLAEYRRNLSEIILQISGSDLDKQNVQAIFAPFQISEDNFTIETLFMYPQLIPRQYRVSINRLKSLQRVVLYDYRPSQLATALQAQGVENLKIKELQIFTTLAKNDTTGLEYLKDHFDLEYITLLELLVKIPRVTKTLKKKFRRLFSQMVNVKHLFLSRDIVQIENIMDQIQPNTIETFATTFCTFAEVQYALRNQENSVVTIIRDDDSKIGCIKGPFRFVFCRVLAMTKENSAFVKSIQENGKRYPKLKGIIADMCYYTIERNGSDTGLKLKRIS